MKKVYLLILILPLLTISSHTLAQAPMEIVSYYFVELIPNQEHGIELEKLKTLQVEHMNNIKTMATEGKLLLAGPFADGGGLFILTAESAEQAEDWVKADPAVAAGRFTYKIRQWYTEKGMLSLEKD